MLQFFINNNLNIITRIKKVINNSQVICFMVYLLDDLDFNRVFGVVEYMFKSTY